MIERNVSLWWLLFEIKFRKGINLVQKKNLLKNAFFAFVGKYLVKINLKNKLFYYI